MSAGTEQPPAASRGPIRILLCGDVMLGRGIDQILPHSNDPTIYEHWRRIDDARTFVELAIRQNGPLPELRDAAYVWGDVLGEFTGAGTDLRLVNLETAVSTSADLWPDKTIRYRTHPENIATLRSAKLDCCSLANNHVLDWGYRGLEETIDGLRRAGIRTAGAGRNRREADMPAVIDVPGKGRVAVFAFATPSSGIPAAWAAGANQAGVSLIGLSDSFVAYIATLVSSIRSDVAVVIASIHWGGNWGHEIPPPMRQFAHRLIDEAGIDMIYGHSSHHVKAIEVYRDKLILYGCGDLISDYEGIPLHWSSRSTSSAARFVQFKPDLGHIYHAQLDAASGALQSLDMTPTRIRQMRINRAGAEGTGWLADMLNREGAPLGTRVDLEGGALKLRW